MTWVVWAWPMNTFIFFSPNGNQNRIFPFWKQGWLTSTNQQLVKSTINDLIVKQELPDTATVISSPPLLELRVFTFYPQFTNLTTQADLSCLPVVTLPNSFPLNYLDKVMAPVVRSLPSYVKNSQHALQIFRDFNFLGEDKLIFIPSSLMAKVF